MVVETTQSNTKKRLITNHFKDKLLYPDGLERERATYEDFHSVDDRAHNAFINCSGVGPENEECSELYNDAVWHYNNCRYTEALPCFTKMLEVFPSTEPLIFYYIRRCEYVSSIPLQPEEISYAAKLERRIAKPRLLKWLVPTGEFRGRCKWCGRYTNYVGPETPTFGAAYLNNCCRSCMRAYPMPSFKWDSPDGRAYSYYRGSFNDEAFYEEFESDYDPKPVSKA